MNCEIIIKKSQSIFKQFKHFVYYNTFCQSAKTN